MLAEAVYPDCKDFPKFYLNSNATDFYNTMFEALQSMIKENLGIDSELAMQDAAARGAWRNEKPTKLHLWRERWGMDFPDSHNSLQFMVDAHGLDSPNSKLDGNIDADLQKLAYDNATFEELVAQGGREPEPAKRAELYKQAQQELVVTNPYIIPLYYGQSNVLVKPHVKGLYINGLGINYRNVTIEK